MSSEYNSGDLLSKRKMPTGSAKDKKLRTDVDGMVGIVETLGGDNVELELGRENGAEVSDAGFWKGEYEKLRELRTTQAEQQMKMMKDWADDKIKAMQDQINFLEEQIGIPADQICR